MILNDAQERTRFMRFAVVGAIGAVIDFGTFNLLMQFSSLQAVIASMVSFTAAVTSNFIWNRYWTYPDSRSKALSKQLTQFFLVNLVGLGIRTPLFAWLEQFLTTFLKRLLPAGFFLTPTFIAHNLALAVAVLVVMMWNFLVNRFWTYNDVSKANA
jgi:putative flippase GtrA